MFGETKMALGQCILNLWSIIAYFIKGVGKNVSWVIYQK